MNPNQPYRPNRFGGNNPRNQGQGPSQGNYQRMVHGNPNSIHPAWREHVQQQGAEAEPPAGGQGWNQERGGYRQGFRPQQPPQQPFSPNPALPPMVETWKVPANSLLPIDAQVNQAPPSWQPRQNQGQGRWQGGDARRGQQPYAPAPAAEPIASQPAPVEPQPAAAPAPAPAPAPAAPVQETLLREDLGERHTPAEAPQPAAPAAPAAHADAEEDEDDNIGNRMDAALPALVPTRGRGRQQTRAMQSAHQQQARGQRRFEPRDNGVDSANSILRQASQQQPAVQGNASDLRPRRPHTPRQGDSRGRRDSGYRQW